MANKEVVEMAMTSITKMHMEIVTHTHKLPKDFHTAEIKAFGTKSIIDHIAMSEELKEQMQYVKAEWPEVSYFNPDHALVYTATAIYEVPPQRRSKEAPSFPAVDPSDELSALADSLTKKALDLQKQARKNVLIEEKKKFMDAERKFTHERAALDLQGHLPPEMISYQRMRAARKRKQRFSLVFPRK